MTIIVGLKHNEGLVMAADSEETSNLKRRVPKLPVYLNTEGGALIVGGAGPDYQVEAISELLQDDFKDATAHNFVEVKRRLGERIRNFYHESVLRWPTVEEREDSDFSLLLGASVRIGGTAFLHHLLIAEKGILRRGWPYQAIGMGATYARILLDRYSGVYPFSTAVLVAIDVIQKVKRDTPYCGKETQVWWSKGGQRGPVFAVEDAEGVFRQLEHCLTKQFFVALEGSAQDDEHMQSELKTLREKFSEVRSKLGCV